MIQARSSFCQGISLIQTIRGELKGVKTYICTDDKVDAMSSYEEVLSHADPSEPDSSFIHEDDLVSIFYTSGTTGYPKGVMISHKNRMTDIIHQAADFEYIEPEDVYLNIGPLFHVAVFGNSLAHLYMGCTVVIIKEFDPKRIFELIEKEKFEPLGRSHHDSNLLDSPERKKYDLTSIKTIAYASSPMPMETMKKAMEFFTSIYLSNFWCDRDRSPDHPPPEKGSCSTGYGKAVEEVMLRGHGVSNGSCQNCR
jgi:acyl-coenzyme A synthetase/AMP-(fatty) acid ligase